MGTSSATRDGGPTADNSGATPDAYDHLRAKKRQRRGNDERARVRDVFVGGDEVVLTLGFEWTDDAGRVAYDLDDDRDVLELERLAESSGFAFEQVSFLEGERLPVVYTGSEWVPAPHLERADSGNSAGGRLRTGLVRRAVRASRSLTTEQVILGVILAKKLLVVALLVWLLA